MSHLLQILRNALSDIVNDIDDGNSNMTEKDMVSVIEALKLYSHKEQYCTKYEACAFLNNISRATFDNLVASGDIPKGEKLHAGDNNLFWKVTDLMKYRDRNKKRS